MSEIKKGKNISPELERYIEKQERLIEYRLGNVVDFEPDDTPAINALENYRKKTIREVVVDLVTSFASSGIKLSNLDKEIIISRAVTAVFEAVHIKSSAYFLKTSMKLGEVPLNSPLHFPRSQEYLGALWYSRAVSETIKERNKQFEKMVENKRATFRFSSKSFAEPPKVRTIGTML